MPPIIEVKHLTKEYRLGALTSVKDTARHMLATLTGKKDLAWERQCFKALDDVSFSIENGEVVGIIGHNGAGKSTLLKHLANITTQTSGEVCVRGSVAPLIEVGAGINPELTGRENIYLNGAILGIPKKQIEKKIDEIIEFSELEQFINTPVKRYSSGMQVKLGFSIATSVESKILIVDEVLAVGDLAFQRKCFDRMEHLIRREGRTVLLVSHNIRQIERMCERVILLDHGAVTKDGSAKDVCNAFYEQSDQEIVKNQRKAGTASVKATGEVELFDISFVDEEGKKLSDIEYESSVVMRIRLRANKVLNNPIIFLGFHTTDFVYLTASSSNEIFRSESLQCGVYEVTAKIDKFPLLPGVYSARVSIDVEEPIKNIYYGDGLCHFSVSSSQLQRASPQCEDGFIALDANWNIGVI